MLMEYQTLNATVELSNGIILKWDNAKDTFSEYQDTNGYCTLDASNSLKTSVNSTAYKLSFKIKLSWNYTEGSINVVSTNTKCFDSKDTSGSGSQTGLFTFEDDLIISSDTMVDDSRINPSDTITFNGTLYYEGTSIVPEDTSGVTVYVELNETQKGSDSSPSSGVFNISFAGESSVGNYSYLIYAVTDEPSVQNRTVSVVVDQLNCSSYTIDLSNKQLNVTLVYAYDGSSVSDGIVNFHGTNATTDSNGIASFDLSSLSDFDYNQVAYGVTDGSYGITSTIQNQTIPLAMKNGHLIQGTSSLSISSITWDSNEKQLSFSASGSGTQTIKIRHQNGDKPYYVKIDSTVYNEGSHWSWSTPVTTITYPFSSHTFMVSWIALSIESGSSGGGGVSSSGGTFSIQIPESTQKFVQTIIKPALFKIPEYYVGLSILGFMFISLALALRNDSENLSIISIIIGVIITVYVLNLLAVWVLEPQGLFPSDLEFVKPYLWNPPSLNLQVTGVPTSSVQILQLIVITSLFALFASAIALFAWRD